MNFRVKIQILICQKTNPHQPTTKRERPLLVVNSQETKNKEKRNPKMLTPNALLKTRRSGFSLKTKGITCRKVKSKIKQNLW